MAADGALDQRGELAAAQPRQAPGEMLRNCLAHVARGADAVCFFQWRASRAPARRSSTRRCCRTPAPTPRSGASVVELGARAAAARRGRRQPGRRPQAAIVFDWHGLVGRRAGRAPVGRRHLPGPRARALHAALWRPSITADVVRPSAPTCRGYALVVVPDAVPGDRRRAPSVCADVAEAAGTRWSRTSRASPTSTTTSASAATPARSASCSACASRSSARCGRRAPCTSTTAAPADVWTELTHLVTAAEVVATYADGPVAGSAGVTAATGRRRGRLVRRDAPRRRRA